MSDLINRQYVVDHYDCEDKHGTFTNFQSILEFVNSLPSEEPEIILCRECKFVEHDKLFHDFWCRGREVEPDHYCGYAERRDDEQ